MNIIVDKDEWYPVYSVTTSGADHPNEYMAQYVRQWPEAWNYQDYRDTLANFEEWQEKLSKLYKKNN